MLLMRVDKDRFFVIHKPGRDGCWLFPLIFQYAFAEFEIEDFWVLVVSYSHDETFHLPVFLSFLQSNQILLKGNVIMVIYYAF